MVPKNGDWDDDAASPVVAVIALASGCHAVEKPDWPIWACIAATCRSAGDGMELISLDPRNALMPSPATSGAPRASRAPPAPERPNPSPSRPLPRGACSARRPPRLPRSEEHTSELQSLRHLVC